MAVKDDIADIRKHIDIINTEMSELNEKIGSVNIKIAKIQQNWNWMRLLLGANVTLWVAVLGVLLRMNGI